MIRSGYSGRDKQSGSGSRRRTGVPTGCLAAVWYGKYDTWGRNFWTGMPGAGHLRHGISSAVLNEHKDIFPNWKNDARTFSLSHQLTRVFDEIEG